MATRQKQIKKISVPGWKEDKFPVRRIDRRYIKTVKGDNISAINVDPSRYENNVKIRITGKIFSIPERVFKTDTQANAYAKKVMLHINRQIKEFGID